MLTFLFTGTPADLIEVKSIKLSPDPPVPGQDLTVTASGYVKDTIEVCAVLLRMKNSERNIHISTVGGLRWCDCQDWPYQAVAQAIRYLWRSVRSLVYLSWPLTNATPHPSQSMNATVKCPVERDNYVVTQTVALPKEIPKGKNISRSLDHCSIGFVSSCFQRNLPSRFALTRKMRRASCVWTSSSISWRHSSRILAFNVHTRRYQQECTLLLDLSLLGVVVLTTHWLLRYALAFMLGVYGIAAWLAFLGTLLMSLFLTL